MTPMERAADVTAYFHGMFGKNRDVGPLQKCIAEHITAAVQAERIEATRVERERCAGIAREMFDDPYNETRANDAGFVIADAIDNI